MNGWVTLSEAAAKLGLSAARVRQLVDSGELLGRRGPYGREVDAEDLERLIIQRRAG